MTTFDDVDGIRFDRLRIAAGAGLWRAGIRLRELGRADLSEHAFQLHQLLELTPAEEAGESLLCIGQNSAMSAHDIQLDQVLKTMAALAQMRANNFSG
ncbi:MAG: hypothetical protein JWO38_1259 [Gemmataceae bacterium]|nr:hypothetical protein [Gemmataceae bacterium]